ncbi:Odorant response abnormal protein 4 [Fasciolopsis buskii]|uniref:Odorant response abnormal protein 4 n=1 Tax=Fasciolopsis buskii TaxID=27845 RepID=A0A8E0RPL9_9TREM|nr:Odorant response abnormal protein 4 [Fasciolopsis buski]
MIKAVSYETAFSSRFSGLHGFHCGVILGGTFENEECLFLPVQLPRKVDAVAECSPNSIQKIDGKWVSSHCKNLQRMIPGGVRISGLCLMCTTSEFNSHHETVKRILLRIPKDDALVQELGGPQNSEHIVLLVDPQTKKFTCYTLDTSSEHHAFGCVPVKFRDLTSLWKSFKTSISLCLETSLPSDRKKEKILRQLQLAVEPYLSALLKDTQLLVNGDYRSPEEKVIFDEFDSATPTRVSTSKASKKSSKASRRRANDSSNVDNSDSEVKESFGDIQKKTVKRSGTFSDVEVDKGSWADVELTIFGPQFPRWQRASSSSSLESGASSDTGFNGGSENADSTASDPVPINRLVLNGKIPGIAFLPRNTTTRALLQVSPQSLSLGESSSFCSRLFFYLKTSLLVVNSTL